MKSKILALILTAILAIMPLQIGLPSGPAQPPVQTSTLFVSNYQWGPLYADPARAFDSMSDQLIFNVYDRLIDFGSVQNTSLGEWQENEKYWEFLPSLSTNVPERQEVFLSIPDTGIDPHNPTSYWAGPLSPDERFYHIEGWIDENSTGELDAYDVIYLGEYSSLMLPIQAALTIRTWQVISFTPGVELRLHHYFYDFFVRTSPLIRFVDFSGVTVDFFDIGDVEYSIERGLVQDQWGSPMWELYMPLFDQTNSEWLEDSGLSPATASYFLAWLIKDAIEILPGNVTRINVVAFPDIALKQILARTTGSIVSESWCISKGCWNGLFEDVAPADGIVDFYTQWRHITTSPIQLVDRANYAGTGPYHLTYASESDNLVMLNRTLNYWKGWPAPGRKAFLDCVAIDYGADWTTKKANFEAGRSDIIYASKAQMSELLGPYNEPLNPATEVINYLVDLAVEAVFYTWDVDPSYHNFLYTGTFPTGVPTDFLNNEHVRKAFSYAFDHSKYVADASLYDQLIARETPGVYGLFPDYYSMSPDPPLKYDYNLDQMKSELEQAIFTQDAVTQSVWDWGGFHIDVVYNLGNDHKRIACEVLKKGFDDLNAKYGKNFQVTIQSCDFPTYLQYLNKFCMPVWLMGFIPEFADADELYRTFMNGELSYWQHYPATTNGPITGMNKDQLVDLAVMTSDGQGRRNMYSDLDYIYLSDNPGFPYGRSFGRKWMKYWVRGWCPNALYQSDYYYSLYKEDTCWADVTGSTYGIPDGICNMRDVGYVASRFGAKAPDTARTPPYDPKWAPGTYGMAGCDVYEDRKSDMRDIGFLGQHFGHTTRP